MESKIKIGTWNLCLGLPNKKDIVTRYLKENNVDVCCLQETEVQLDFPENILNCCGYNLELENNDVKKRTGIYIAQGIDYIRRKEYEKSGFHIVIIDLIRSLPIIIICVYCSFRPTGISPIKFFDTQLGILSSRGGLVR